MVDRFYKLCAIGYRRGPAQTGNFIDRQNSMCQGKKHHFQEHDLKGKQYDSEVKIQMMLFWRHVIPGPMTPSAPVES